MTVENTQPVQEEEKPIEVAVNEDVATPEPESKIETDDELDRHTRNVQHNNQKTCWLNQKRRSLPEKPR
jgi:hypothetical protein